MRTYVFAVLPMPPSGALRHGLVQQTDQIAASRDLSLIVAIYP